MRTVTRLIFGLAISLCCEVIVRAEWRTDAGYFTLSSELGAAIPTGAGIPIFQCEADADGVSGAPYVYLPQTMTTDPWTGTGTFAGKTFHLLAGTGTASGHADSVCNTMCSFASISAGVTTVYSHVADEFYADITSGNAPPSFASRGTVQNNSWIALATTTTEASDYLEMLRRYDFMLNRDSVFGVVALNNGIGAVPHLMAPSYNAICAGVRSGSHSTSGTLTDQDGPGRMKPDLVVDQPYTSLAAPSIASAAALLYDVIRPTFPDADHPQAMKAILLAGASKTNLPAWHRQTTAKPYDNVFGAGELNVLNAYHILAKGRQIYSPSEEVTSLGWDYNTSSSSTARRYFFTVPAGRMADTFSVALTWHRVVTHIGPVYSTSVPDLNLKLYASTNFTPAASPIDQSISSVDNVEHLWLRNLPAGQYMLEVTSNTNNHIYALAWEAQLGSGPQLSAQRTSGSQVTVSFSVLDPYAIYTIESATTLGPSADWTSATTFKTADTSPSTTFSWADTVAGGGAKFYRLKWTAVR